MNKTEDWKKQIAKEMEKTSSILNDLGFSLEESQIHVLGERYLIGGKKLVLLGRNKKTNDKVIIKVSSHPSGIKEIRKERASKNILEEIKFAYHVFNFPKEILFTQKNGYLILVTSFIEQDKKFLEHSLREQFFLALKIFEIQEGVHATTSEHSKTIKKYFGQMNAKDYIKSFKNNQKNILLKIKDSKIKRLLSEAQNKLEKNADTINLYFKFLSQLVIVP